VRLPLNKIGSINKINKTFNQLEQSFEREPTIIEISQAMELAPEDIKDAMRSSGRHISMDAPFRKVKTGICMTYCLIPILQVPIKDS